MFPSQPRARVQLTEETFTPPAKRGGKPTIVAGATQHLDSFNDKSFFASVGVELTTDKASEAELTVVDEDLSFLDAYTRDDGVLPCAVQIWLGHGQDMGTPVFDGLLAAVEHADHLTTLCFYDRSMRMKLAQRTEQHKGTDLDVMRKLAERNGLKLVLADTTIKGLPLKSRKQEAQTDYEFFMGLARDAGLVTWVRGDSFFVARPARVSSPVLTLKPRDVIALEGAQFRYETPENVDGRPCQRRGQDQGQGRPAPVRPLHQEEGARPKEDRPLQQTHSCTRHGGATASRGDSGPGE